MSSNQQRCRVATLLAVTSLLLAACVSPGGYGSAYPGGSYGQSAPGAPDRYGDQIVGTVQSVDPGYNRILLVVDDGSRDRGRQVEVRYDQRTQLRYQGQVHPVEGLEPGDVIRVDAAQSGRDWVARSIEVLRNVRESGGYGYGNDYGNEMRGAVAVVDPRARVIRLEGNGYGGNAAIGYDNRTVVEYQGRSYRPENLQRGDLVRIQSRRTGNNQWLAERILVERSAGRY